MSSDFETALAAGDIAALRALPKADLHNHAIGGGNRDFVREKTGVDVAPIDHVLHSMDEMHEWAGKHTGQAFKGPHGRMIGIEATFVQARLDGVTRLDVGEDVWAMTLWENRDVARLTETMREIHQRVAPEIEWTPQMGLSRHCPIQYLMEWSAPFLDLDFYQTVDLYADEFAQPISVFKPVYRAAKAKGLRLRAHAGEWGTADDVWQAVEELELDEVQHGIAAADSPAVMRFLADNKIRLNVCPTSNIMLGRVESMAAHPIRKLFDAGVIVTVNTDDALMFGIGVADEYLALYRAGVFTAAELDQIRLNGLTDQPLRL
jgi:adenosine deaminase